MTRPAAVTKGRTVQRRNQGRGDALLRLAVAEFRATLTWNCCYGRAMCLTDLSGKLVDGTQRRRVQQAVHDRLADDQDQDSCRYIMRFWWQLSMSYTEVTLEQLREYVHEPKLTAIERLIDAIRSCRTAGT